MTQFESFLIYEKEKNTFAQKIGFSESLIVNSKVVDIFKTKHVLSWKVTRNSGNKMTHRIFMEYEDLKQ